MSEAFRVSQHDFDVVFQPIERAPERIPQGIRNTWFRLGKYLKKKTSADILKKPKHGRTYYRRTKSGARRVHVASKPGETHANMTGELRRSLSWKVYSFSKMGFGYGVSTNASNKTPIYGAAIEFGKKWKNPDREIKPRPSIKNNIRKAESVWDRFFVEEMEVVYKRNSKIL
jgi:hypothetical protein